ncbi:MAG: cation:proton antiporter [Desulfuromusa sp.]|nr:cation:proton antiporter [Desulfuromusa sp.]
MENHIAAQILMTFGGLFLLGLIADLVGRHTPLPRVTLLLLSGFVVGPSVLDLLPSFTDQWFPVLTNVALAMIGFMLGQKMTRATFHNLGRAVLGMSVGVVFTTASVVFLILFLFGVPFEVSLLLAGISTATDPAATLDVVREYRAKGTFTDTLLGIVAIDDVLGLLLFSLLSVIVQSVGGQVGAVQILTTAAWEIGGAVLLGVLLGWPMAYLSGRIRPGEATQAETLGLVLLCTGLAVWLEVSYLLAAMVLGTVVANFCKHCDRPFHAIEEVEWPFLILFFLLAGAALHIDAIGQVGLLGLGYIFLRVAGRIIGSWVGGILGKTDLKINQWMGIALLPQAGVAIAMVLLASQRFPELKDILLPIIIGSTVIFELIGPILTRLALVHVGNVILKKNHSSSG